MRPTTILRSMDCGCCITEVENDSFPLVWSNPEFERITGYSAEELIGHDPWFLHSGICKEAEITMKRIVSQGKSCRGIIQIVRKNGALRWVEVTGRPSREDGYPRLLGMIDDWDESWQAKFAALSRRQQRVFSLLANGARVSHVAQNLRITLGTSYRHYREIRELLDIEDFAELYLLRG